MPKKQDELLKQHLGSRCRKALIEAGKTIGTLTSAQKKTPSQRKSENLKKRLSRGVVELTDLPEDCFGCSKYPCGKKLVQCEERSIIHRCMKCGVKVRHRIQEDAAWELCPVCWSKTQRTT